MTEEEKKIDTQKKFNKAIDLLGKSGVSFAELGKSIKKSFYLHSVTRQIEAKELRIGNSVIIDGHITTITDSIMFDNDESSWYVDDIDITLVDPIQLTEQWLLRFGFKYIKEVIGYADSLHLICRYKEGYCFMPFCTNDKDCHIMIKHVHQLENLYFALTQKELIKAKKS